MGDSVLARAIEGFSAGGAAWGFILMIGFGAAVVFGTRWRHNYDKRDRK